MGSRMNKLGLIRTSLAALALAAFGKTAMAQSAVTLTAAPTTANLPDGQNVPMWGYTCGAVSGTGMSCTALNTTQST